MRSTLVALALFAAPALAQDFGNLTGWERDAATALHRLGYRHTGGGSSTDTYDPAARDPRRGLQAVVAEEVGSQVTSGPLGGRVDAPLGQDAAPRRTATAQRAHLTYGTFRVERVTLAEATQAADWLEHTAAIDPKSTFYAEQRGQHVLLVTGTLDPERLPDLVTAAWAGAPRQAVWLLAVCLGEGQGIWKAERGQGPVIEELRRTFESGRKLLDERGGRLGDIAAVELVPARGWSGRALRVGLSTGSCEVHDYGNGVTAAYAFPAGEPFAVVQRLYDRLLGSIDRAAEPIVQQGTKAGQDGPVEQTTRGAQTGLTGAVKRQEPGTRTTTTGWVVRDTTVVRDPQGNPRQERYDPAQHGK